MIVNGNSMNGKKIHTSTRDMQIFSKMKFAMGSFDNCMTNVMDPHTCTTSSVDLVLAAVFFPHGHLLKFAGDVFGGATVDVPVGVDAIGAVRSSSHLVLVLGGVIIIVVAVPTVPSAVPEPAADMAARRIRARSVGAAAAAQRPLGLLEEDRSARGLTLLEEFPLPPDLALPRGGPSRRPPRPLEAAFIDDLKPPEPW